MKICTIQKKTTRARTNRQTLRLHRIHDIIRLLDVDLVIYRAVHNESRHVGVRRGAVLDSRRDAVRGRVDACSVKEEALEEGSAVMRRRKGALSCQDL